MDSLQLRVSADLHRGSLNLAQTLGGQFRQSAHRRLFRVSHALDMRSNMVHLSPTTAVECFPVPFELAAGSFITYVRPSLPPGSCQQMHARGRAHAFDVGKFSGACPLPV
eukprot:2354825-Pleurochrysis_carterae.AAC.1